MSQIEDRQIRRSFEELEHYVITLESERSILSDQVQSLNNDIEDLSNQVVELEEKVDELQEALAEAHLTGVITDGTSS